LRSLKHKGEDQTYAIGRLFWKLVGKAKDDLLTRSQNSSAALLHDSSAILTGTSMILERSASVIRQASGWRAVAAESGEPFPRMNFALSFLDDSVSS
jgi:hypothetical protein